MIEKLYFCQYRFILTPKATIQVSKYGKGNLIRGAFGSSLRRLLCIVQKGGQNIDCPGCQIKERCPYALIFSPIGLTPAKRLQNPPRGYVIKPPLGTELEYHSEKPLIFDIVLIGDRTHFLPYLIVSLNELGQKGIGLNRGKFNLTGIEIIKNGESIPIYDYSSNTVKNLDGRILGSEIISQAKSLDPKGIKLHFLTPTRIKYNPTGEKGKAEVVRVPEFHHLIRRLRDRLNALCVTYCGGPLEIDFREIAERARSVKTVRVNLKWVEQKRKGSHDQSGFVGDIVFQGDLSEYLPLIVAGHYLHVGEDAVFGHGWYEMHVH